MIEEKDGRRYDEGCTEDYSMNGLCPCCGAELNSETEETWTGTFHNVLVTTTTQWCTSCDWQSAQLIDDVDEYED